MWGEKKLEIVLIGEINNIKQKELKLDSIMWILLIIAK